MKKDEEGADARRQWCGSQQKKLSSRSREQALHGLLRVGIRNVKWSDPLCGVRASHCAAPSIESCGRMLTTRGDAAENKLAKGEAVLE